MRLASDNVQSFADRVATLAAGCMHKEADQLTDLERLALAILAGVELEWTGTGVKARNPFGVQKINGRFIVRESHACPKQSPRGF